ASVAALLSGEASLRLAGGGGAILSIGLALRGRMPTRLRATIVGLGAAAWLFGFYSVMVVTYLTYTAQAAAGAYALVATLTLGVATLSTALAVNMRVVERFVP